MTDANVSGLPVGGYKPQTAEAVNLVNLYKVLEEKLLRELDALVADKRGVPCDPRLAAVARTHFQEGFMALNRAVFQPARLTDDDIAKFGATMAAPLDAPPAA